MMRRFFLLTVLLLLTPTLLLAQKPRIVADDDWCDAVYAHDDGERACEVREITLPADRDEVAIDGRQNGGIQVEGWDRDEILVRARVDARARSEDGARRLLDDVQIRTDGTIRATDPDTRTREWVAVQYHVYVPHASNLDLEAHNGGITIHDVQGAIAFRTLNGGVTLAGLGGDVRGTTTNGGLTVELSGPRWDGRGLDVKTTNGSVTLVVPEDYSAELETGTVNGRVRTDFPVMVEGDVTRDLSTTLGDGGAPLRLSTTNGSVHIQRG
ncbi:MAG: DUF4097 family beta strand repeat protein [Bacteroidetes bacterium]|jgi:hypothetical protein|nr:DUF4097 family beta strand repeat protein [Bacteroidota bacterium]